MERYSRHILLEEIGQTGQQKLNTSKVLVVGAGGLGCPTLQYLAAAGIGTIGIIDPDFVVESNLQRQILFGNSSLGQNKAVAARDRLSDLNSEISIVAYPERLHSENALDLFHQFDIIVDGTDNFETRYLINDAAVLSNKPVIYGAIYKFEGQVSVFNYNQGPTYRCLFPIPPKEGSVANCSDIGVLGVLPGIIGSLQANEVLKILLNLNTVLTGKLLCYDARTNQMTTMKINRNKAEINALIASGELKKIGSNPDSCQIRFQEIALHDAFNFIEVQFLDVRELHETPKLDHPNCIQIPLSELEDNLNRLSRNDPIVVFCQSGIRSKQAITILVEHNITNCYNLTGGMHSIIRSQKSYTI